MLFSLGQVKMRLFVVCALLVFSFPFIITEVVDSFSECSEFFLEGKPPVIPDILKDGTSQDNNRYKLICQRYKNAYRFATLYDTTNKIPVFSAYRYTGVNSKQRPHIAWMIEPQLETLGAEMNVPCVNQAYAGDYWKKLDRGHLFPNGHAVDKDTAESTFTLTNVVPQHNSFNNGSWLRMEQKVRSIMFSHCHDKDNPRNNLAYVLTGAVPSKNNLLNKRVNIPTHMWTAFCCYNSTGHTWASQAYSAENKDEKNPGNITAKPLWKLQEFLKGKYSTEIPILFNGDCLNFFNTIGDAYPQDEVPKSWFDLIKSLPDELWGWIFG